jgi:acetylornithine/succinyldiaminopimelate/putrescine aminotransferase
MVNALKDKGLLVVGAGENVIRILPPLNITKNDILKATSILQSTLLELQY